MLNAARLLKRASLGHSALGSCPRKQPRTFSLPLRGSFGKSYPYSPIASFAAECLRTESERPTSPLGRPRCLESAAGFDTEVEVSRPNSRRPRAAALERPEPRRAATRHEAFSAPSCYSDILHSLHKRHL